jgi:HD-GYP domain-containing protein (c-di-GMP phosphodiesterase class II)
VETPFAQTLLIDAIEMKDSYTRGHCRRVRDLARRIALSLGLAGEPAAALEIGALLHDVGKIVIPEPLLRKRGRLDDLEVKRLRRHTVMGEGILTAVELFAPALKIVRHHHERFDGAGYPDGLRGERIDLSARIVALSDAFDAMTTERPYRDALPLETALAELARGRASQFDPLLVDLFIGKELYRPLTS